MPYGVETILCKIMLPYRIVSTLHVLYSTLKKPDFIIDILLCTINRSYEITE